MAGLLDRLIRKPDRRAAPDGERRGMIADARVMLGQSYDTAAGETITPSTALAISTVYACVRVLSESIAALPLKVYERRPDGSRERLVDHPLTRLLSVAPNDEMTAYEYRELMLSDVLLRGNHYSEITRSNGRPVELYPLRPDLVEVIRRDGRIVYRRKDSGADLPAADVLHIKGLSPNGLVGFSPLQIARETFGHARAAQQYGARLIGNDSRPPGILVHPGSPTKEALARIRESWEASQSGANRGRIAVLPEDMKWTQLSITPEDAQFLETRKLERAEICGIFRVPPHLVADLERATFSNIEIQDLAYAKHTLVPWCERIEQAIVRRLVFEREWGRVYVEHDLAGIMRGDVKTRYEAYGLLWDRGVISADEIRALENMNPQPDGLGATYYRPLNFVPAGSNPVAIGAPEPPDTERQQRRDPETRARRDASVRQQLHQSFTGVLGDAMRRVIRRERQQILAAAKRELGERSAASFVQWLTEFYADTEYTVRQVRPAFEALAQAVGPEAMRELEADWQYNDALRAWVDSYVTTFAEQHAIGSRAQLEQLVAEAADDLLEVIEQRLDEWENGADSGTPRADKIAAHEARRFGNSFARTVFGVAGVTALVWRAVGDTCPFCLELDGTVVGIDRPFVAAGETLDVGDAAAPMTPSFNVMSPPIHAGCDCVITPEV